MRSYSYKDGFSLYEMSVTLVIVGLIVGGLIVGKDLIRAAEVRSVLSDSEKIQNAIYAFRKKFDYLPGDFPRAVSYWGQDPGGCPAASNTVPKTTTCNGDGNGKLNKPAGGHVCAPITAGSFEQEPYRLWQHLANAEMFPGFYTGVEGSAASILYGRVGTNIPKSLKMDGVGFQLMNFDNDPTIDIGWFVSTPFSNIMIIGLQDTIGTGTLALPGTPCYEPNQPFLSSLEVSNMDQKIDDGLPGKGNLRVYSDNQPRRCTSTNNPNTALYTDEFNTDCSLLLLLNW